jgi:cyclophilin family peptidyl-prolyl cis-trans isomerase/HEAT repeat protein
MGAVASPRSRARFAIRWGSAPSTVALVVALVALCAPSAASQQPRSLTDEDVRRFAALLRMTDARQQDSAVVRAALASRSSTLRAAGALAIGQARATSMLGSARALLSDPDTGVAAAAAFAIGLLRDSLSVVPLAAALSAPPTVAVEAAWALGQIGAPARAALERALARESRDARVTGALLLAAAKLRPVPVEWLGPYLRHASPEIRWRAAYVVARPFAAAGVRALLPLARDTSAMVRAQVARALSRAAAGDSLRALALPLLDSLARDPHPHTRIHALRSLGTYGTAARAPLVAAVRDGDANVRITAAQSLAEALEATREAWLPLWDADTSLMYRRSLLASAMRGGVALPVADANGTHSWATSPDWRERAALAEAVGGSPTAEQRRALALPLTRDPDARVRAAAHDAIASLADSAARYPWARSALYVAFVDADVSVRAGAIGSMIERASAADLPVVLDAYRSARGDTVSDARLTALRFIQAVWRRDSASIPDSLRRVLSTLPVPSDPLEHAAVAGVTPLESWTSARAAPLRPVQWYETRLRELVLPALRGRRPRAEFTTDRGTIIVELLPIEAPLTVHNFVSLARSGYYTDVRFHRVVPSFVAQDGDRRGDGNGGPSYAIRDELNRHRYERGAVGMALSGPDTGGSQYFLTLSPQPHLDGGYTVFGRVLSGLDVMDALVQGDRIKSIRIR